MSPWRNTLRSSSIWLGKDSDRTSGSLEIQHVAILQTDILVLVRMLWPKIHRWQLFVTRIDSRSVASVQDGQSILHNTPTFELPSVHVVPVAMWFSHRCSLFCNILWIVHFSVSLAFSNSSRVHCLSLSMSCSKTACARSVCTLIGRPERYSSLVDTHPCWNFPTHCATVWYGRTLFSMASTNSLRHFIAHLPRRMTILM